jgi:hypothetical protein
MRSAGQDRRGPFLAIAIALLSVSLIPLSANAGSSRPEYDPKEALVRPLSAETTKALSIELGQNIFYLLSFDANGQPVVGVPNTSRVEVFASQKEAFASKGLVNLKSVKAITKVRFSASPDTDCVNVEVEVFGNTYTVCVSPELVP